MTENTKWKIGILALIIMLISLIVYSSIVIAEYYVSLYGEEVDAKVTGVDHVCRPRNKYVTLQVGTESVKMELYGPSCRKADFILGSMIKIRRNVQLNVVMMQGNYSTFRLIIFPFMTGLLCWQIIRMVKERKRKSHF